MRRATDEGGSVSGTSTGTGTGTETGTGGSDEDTGGSGNGLDDNVGDAVTIDKFVEEYADGKTHDELVRLEESANIFYAKGPPDSIKYVLDPLNEHQVIDMRHFLVAGSFDAFTGTPIPGYLIETKQFLSSNPGQNASAFHPQDLFSNQLGAQFFRSSHFNPWMPNQIGRQIRTFLRSRGRNGGW